MALHFCALPTVSSTWLKILHVSRCCEHGLTGCPCSTEDSGTLLQIDYHSETTILTCWTPDFRILATRCWIKASPRTLEGLPQHHRSIAQRSEEWIAIVLLAAVPGLEQGEIDHGFFPADLMQQSNLGV